jgi:hypothetical protein
VCRIQGAETVETSSAGRANRRTALTEEQRRRGELDVRFHEATDYVSAEQMAKLRDVLKHTSVDKRMKDENVLKDWTAARVLELATKGASHNTAPGPSGLCHKYLAEATVEARETFAAMVGAVQESAVRPEAWRRAYEYPVPKPGVGGGSLDGARRICMIEVAAKMLDAEIGKGVAAEWRRLDTLHKWQGGFTKHRGSGEMAAACGTVLDRARRNTKRPMFAVFLDVAKAFPSVPHWGVELGLRRTAVTERIEKVWMEAERGRKSGRTTRTQVLTDWGPTEDIDGEGGLLMGQTGSPPKWLAFIDALMCWLDECGVKGVQVRRVERRDGEGQGTGVFDETSTPIMVFADDMALFVEGSIEDGQKALYLVDHYLQLFGIDLNAGKSVVMKVGGPMADAKWKDTEVMSLTRYRQVDGVKRGETCKLERATRQQGVKYLGSHQQADGKWGAAERDFKKKVQGYCRTTDRADVSPGQARQILQSQVGGLVQYLAQATGISEACCREADDRIGRVVGRKAGLPKFAGGGSHRAAAMFVPTAEGGVGLESMVTRRRKVIVESVLTWLNRAMLGGVDKTPVDDLWLKAWKEEITEQGGEETWSRKKSESGRGDKMRECRDILAAMNMKIVDVRRREEREEGSNRRTRDAALADMLERATLGQLGLTEGGGEAQRAACIADLGHRMETRDTVEGKQTSKPLRFLGQLASEDGGRIHIPSRSTPTGRRDAPRWLKVIFRVCGGTGNEEYLELPEEWRCSARTRKAAQEGETAGEPRLVTEQNRGRCAGELPTTRTDESAVRELRRAPGKGGEEGESMPDIETREGERKGYEEAPTTTDGVGEEEMGEIDLELMSDGTGGGEAAGLAWATVWHKEGGDIRGTGFVPGRAESHRSEFGGLCQNLKEVLKEAERRQAAGEAVCAQLRRVRLNTDCEGAQKAAKWALQAPTGKILRHKNRVLMLEWIWLHKKVTNLGIKVVIGWIKAHTERRSWPHVVQGWCDEYATEANGHGDRVKKEATIASDRDAPFILWDSRQGTPVWEGWGEAIEERTREELVARGQEDGSTAAEWMRLRAAHFTTEAEWDGRPLAAKHGAIARGRFAAQWDVVNGPYRWTAEEQARKKGKLAEWTWTCRSCGKESRGSWEAHASDACASSEAAREYVDGLAGTQLVRQMAMDPATVQRAWERWGKTWMEMRKGGEWKGFRLREVTLPGPAHKPRGGVGATDGERAVFSAAEKKEAEQQWAREHPEEKKGKDEEGNRAAKTLAACDGRGTQLLPLTLFLLYERWQQMRQDPEEFAEAVRAVVVRERKRAEEEVQGSKLGRDAWAWPGPFVDWAGRHAIETGGEPPLMVLFTGLINHASGPTPGCTAEPEDSVWGMKFDAWKEADGMERVWGTGETKAGRLQGNPPYDAESVEKFSQAAQKATVSVMGVLPVLPGNPGRRITRALATSGGVRWARVPKGSMRFIPIGFWTVHAGRGGGDGCGTQSEVLIMEWRRAEDIAPGGVEAIELRELLLAMGKRGVWPDMPEAVIGREGWSDISKWLCTPNPLGKETVPYEVAARGDEAAREEEEEWREEAAKSKRAKPMGGWPGGAVPRLRALMRGPWKGLRWWRAEGAGAPPATATAEQTRTWRRMAHWGMVPDEVHEMLRFAGLSDVARRRVTGKVAEAQRTAAAQAVWDGRAKHEKATQEEEKTRRERKRREREERGIGQESGDGEEQGSEEELSDAEEEGRGLWEGCIRGEGPERAKQNRAEGEKTKERRRAARTAKEDAKYAAELVKAAERQNRRESGQRGRLEWAGVETSTASQLRTIEELRDRHELAQKAGQDRQAKSWKALADWWKGGKQRSLAAGPLKYQDRFPGVSVKTEAGQCESSTLEGERCEQQGFRRGGTVACRSCRLNKGCSPEGMGARVRIVRQGGDFGQSTTEDSMKVPGWCRKAGCQHCRICGTSGGEAGNWGAIGRWTVVCGECIDGMSITPGEKVCRGCGGSEAFQRPGSVKHRAWVGAPDGTWLCGKKGGCLEAIMSKQPGRVWVTRAHRMGQTASEWLGLERWSETDMRWAALDVARAACTLHSGGFAGNMIPWSLWQEAATRRWEKKGKTVEAAQVRRKAWPACTTRDTGHVSRVGSAAENEIGVTPNFRLTARQQTETEGERREREGEGMAGGGENWGGGDGGGEGGGREGERRGGVGREGGERERGENGEGEERVGGGGRRHASSPCSHQPPTHSHALAHSRAMCNAKN